MQVGLSFLWTCCCCISRATSRARERIEQEKKGEREGKKSKVCNSRLIIIFYLFPLLFLLATTLHTITSSIQCQLTFHTVILPFLCYKSLRTIVNNATRNIFLKWQTVVSDGWNANRKERTAKIVVKENYKPSLVSRNRFEIVCKSTTQELRFSSLFPLSLDVFACIADDPFV